MVLFNITNLSNSYEVRTVQDNSNLVLIGTKGIDIGNTFINTLEEFDEFMTKGKYVNSKHYE